MPNTGQAKSLTHSNTLNIALKCVGTSVLSALELPELDGAEIHTGIKKLIQKSETRDVKQPEENPETRCNKMDSGVKTRQKAAEGSELGRIDCP